MITLKNLWEIAENRQPDKIAISFNDKHMSYREVGNCIRHLSANLINKWTVSTGTVIALLAPNCPEFVITYFAVVSIGAIIQPIDERMTFEEIKSVLIDSGASYLIVHHEQFGKFDKIRSDSEINCQDHILGIGIDQTGIEKIEDWLKPQSPVYVNTSSKENDVAELMYTSGTSGEPKPVMRTHANAYAGVQNALRGFGYQTDDTIAIVMPLSHSSALTSQMLPLIKEGGTLVLLNRFEIGTLIAMIQSEGVTCMRAVPAMLQLLLSTNSFSSENLPSLRLLVNSSATIDPDTLKMMKRRFEEIKVMNSYGLTEASTCTILPDSDIQTKPDSIGYPIEGVEMCLMNEQGQLLGDNTEGEICIRGRHVFVGYRNKPKASEDAFISGWLRTGDLGHRDKDGYYYFHGRKMDVINCGGRKVAPIEVENCIMKLSAVANASVIGVPHRVLGQVVKAFVVLEKEAQLNPKQIINHCARNLPSHKIPFFVDIVIELPLNSTGKILRRKLF